MVIQGVEVCVCVYVWVSVRPRWFSLRVYPGQTASVHGPRVYGRRKKYNGKAVGHETAEH